ncbi:MAG: single-stranded DNA-binding protein [Clostridia bacterium]|nr:single-stranded DNA-binding protein [Clostridia bacterium]
MNVVVLVGRLTDNPELRRTNSDIAVTRFSIAVDRAYRSGEERQADFINIVAWRQTAEFITKYFTKGQRIGIEGSLRMNRFTDKDGNNRTTYEVVVNNAHFVENKRDGGNGGSYAPAAQQTAPASFSNSDSGDFTEIPTNDDLPF